MLNSVIYKKILKKGNIKTQSGKVKEWKYKNMCCFPHNICYTCHDLAKIAFSIIRKPNARNWSAYNFQKENGNLSYEEFLSKNSNFQ